MTVQAFAPTDCGRTRASRRQSEAGATSTALVETLVAPRRHHGGSTPPVWVALGAASGRGRMDRHCRRFVEAPKTVLVYPLVRDAMRRLRES